VAIDAKEEQNVVMNLLFFFGDCPIEIVDIHAQLSYSIASAGHSHRRIAFLVKQDQE
jgi:hypothetical protein